MSDASVQHSRHQHDDDHHTRRQKMQRGNFSRRSAPAMWACAALLGVAAVAGGCGAEEESASEARTDVAKSAAANELPRLEGKTITFIGFGGSTDEAFDKTIFAEFEKRTGAKVVLDSPTDYKKIEAQVSSGNVQYDVVDGDPYIMDPECGKQWEELEGIDPSVFVPAFKPGSACTVPDYGYYQQIAVDLEKFNEDGPKTCQDFFDAKKFPGKRAIWSYVEASAALECAAIAAGADPKNPYPLDIDAAIDKLEGLGKDLVLYDSSADAVDKMQNGDVAMGLFTARMVAEATATDATFKASPDWIGRFYGTFGIPKGAPNADAARALLRFISDKEVNPTWLGASGGGVSNVTSPLQLANKAGNLPEAEQIDGIAMNVDWAWWAENDADAVKRFQAATTG